MTFDIRAEWARRPWWMNLMWFFCLYMAFIYMPFDMFWKPVGVEEEVWFGITFHGWSAKLTDYRIHQRDSRHPEEERCNLECMVGLVTCDENRNALISPQECANRCRRPTPDKHPTHINASTNSIRKP